ncbi:MAG: hypothetical protein GXP35_00490 [Actinobacteria bacterium]|nr:hypothetical protein [Actinomycetota bacterium]
MNQEFREYLRSLDMAEPLIDRVETIHDRYLALVPLEFDRIFVTDFITSEGDRRYENLWFFQGDLAFEAHDFVVEDEIDGGEFPYIEIWTVSSVDYDFVEATDDSRLSVDFVSGPISGAMKASGSNCDALRYLISDWIVPRVGRVAAPTIEDSTK